MRNEELTLTQRVQKLHEDRSNAMDSEKALSHSIHTEADSLDELRDMIRDAVACHFEAVRPMFFRLQFVRGNTGRFRVDGDNV